MGHVSTITIIGISSSRSRGKVCGMGLIYSRLRVQPNESSQGVLYKHKQSFSFPRLTQHNSTGKTILQRHR